MKAGDASRRGSRIAFDGRSRNRVCAETSVSGRQAPSHSESSRFRLEAGGAASCLVLTVILTISLLAAPLAAQAQPPRVHRVAIVVTSSPVSELAGPDPSNPSVRAFVRQLRALGYVQGQNLVLELRSAEGKRDRYPAIMAELVALRVDAIVTVGNEMAWAAKRASSIIPIVMATSGDPVGEGLVKSLARPGGNVTGLTVTVDWGIEGKQLQLLKEAAPKISRVAVIHRTPPAPRSFADEFKEMHAAARALNVTLISAIVDRPEQFAEALVTITQERADGLIASAGPFNFTNRRIIVDLAAKSRLPAVYPYKEFVEVGGLMSYGTSIPDLFRRAADYVGKILKGTKPDDLPIEQPVKFELVVSLRIAKALALTIPPSVLILADEVIQ